MIFYILFQQAMFSPGQNTPSLYFTQPKTACPSGINSPFGSLERICIVYEPVRQREKGR